MQDTNLPMCSDDGTLSESTALYRWNELMIKSGKLSGRELTVSSQYKQWMIDVGFEDVVEIEYKWPQNTWPKNPKDKALGAWTLANVLEGLQGFSLALMTRNLEMTTEEIESLLVDVRKEIKNKNIHSYWPM